MSASNKNLQIQAVRGIAIILILAFHFCHAYLEMINYDGNLNILVNQFALCGNITFFLIAGAFMSDPQGGLSFLKKRLAALWPRYALACTILLLFYRSVNIKEKQFSITDYLLNICFINGYTGKFLDGAHWFLVTLVQILFVYSLIFLFDEHDHAGLELAWLVLISMLIVCSKMESGTIGKAAWTIVNQIGSANAGIVVLGRKLRITDTLSWKDIMAALLGLGLFTYHSGALGTVELLVCMTFVWLAFNEKIRFLECRWIVFLGNISYSLYLIHQNIGYFAMQQAKRIVSNMAALPFIGIISGIIAGIFLEKIFNVLRKIVVYIKNRKCKLQILR